MAAKDANECRIRMGEVVVSLESSSPEYAASLQDYFGLGRVDEEPHVRLRLEVTPVGAARDVPNSLLASKRLEAGEFVIDPDLVRGRYDPGGGAGTIAVNCLLTKGQSTRIFEQLIQQAFYSGRERCGCDGFLVHSSAVVRGGAGFLFVGPSEAGKTTVAQLSREHVVLNDEMGLIVFDGDGVELHGTPFNGYFKEKSEGSAPLKAVFLLEKGASHEIRPVGRAKAMTLLATQVVPPVGLSDVLTHRAREAALDVAERLSSRVPVQVLRFSPDPGFWDLIDRAFPTTG
jgi:hypothetical protein